MVLAFSKLVETRHDTRRFIDARNEFWSFEVSTIPVCCVFETAKLVLMKLPLTQDVFYHVLKVWSFRVLFILRVSEDLGNLTKLRWNCKYVTFDTITVISLIVKKYRMQVLSRSVI